VNARVALPSPRVAVRPVTAAGTVAGVTGTGAVAGPAPAALTARTCTA